MRSSQTLTTTLPDVKAEIKKLKREMNNCEGDECNGSIFFGPPVEVAEVAEPQP